MNKYYEYILTTIRGSDQMDRKSFFALKDNVHSYLPIEWDIVLPNFVVDEFGANYPPEHLLLEHYAVKAKDYKLEEDYRISQNVVSSNVLDICAKLGISFVSSRLDIVLYRKKTPLKKYYFFYPKDRVVLMDLDKSSFAFSQVVSEDGKSTVENRDYYDAIDQLIVKSNISSKLFFLQRN